MKDARALTGVMALAVVASAAGLMVLTPAVSEERGDVGLTPLAWSACPD